jgi:hypothetical protein
MGGAGTQDHALLVLDRVHWNNLRDSRGNNFSFFGWDYPAAKE